MDPPFIDPNNPAPKIADGDTRDNVENSPILRESDSPSLPPRRPEGSRGAGAKVRDDVDGPILRIEPEGRGEAESSVEDPAVRLEVLEPSRESPAAKKAPGPRVFAARQMSDVPANDETAPVWQSAVGEGREWGNEKPPESVKWMIYWGAGIAVLLVIGVVLKSGPDRKEQPVNTGVPKADTAARPVEREIAVTDPLLMLETGSRAAYGAYARARTLDEVIPHVRNGDAMRQLLEQEWQPIPVPPDWEPANKTSSQNFQNDSRTYAAVSGILPDFSPFEAYVVPEDGRLAVDWEASTGHGTATFEELESGEGDGSFIRAAIQRGQFYTAAFPESDYRSFRLISVDPDQAIWAYTLRGSAADDAIIALFRPGAILAGVQNEYRICLSLRRGDPESLANQWEIGELLHIDWVRP